MLYRNDGMLLYIGMADAYAAAAEYLKLPRDQETLLSCLKLTGYIKHPTHGHYPGMYTDDTEMSLANARVLIDFDPPYNQLMFANAWVREFERGGRRKGYSQRFQEFLERVATGEEFLAKIDPNSNKNGAAMRAVPFGVLPTAQMALETAELQARITHDTPEGQFSARAVALMSHFALYENKPFTDMPDYCLGLLPKEDVRRFGYVFRQRWLNSRVKSLPHASVAITTVQAVIDLVIYESSLMSILQRTILMGGDTDSVAAIAWGIASSRHQEEMLPDFLERDIERGFSLTGALRLRDVGAALMEKFC